ncbi:hypothetical protein [Agrococcus sp. ARC_14]|uniref:hypothetical protein n=1 Tax=Agrococcus sp. ARC_14 TaxID=2919927 RepID=UPI001F05AD22|nr:hypothetical protein [Agrococcus sp. ARC_14]MCH1881966.1 hypothetical protein [Agrococcus sp. ARC_14]
MAFPAKYPQLNATALTDEARGVLVRVIRVAFPHPSFPDAPYERTADTILTEAEASTWFRVALTQGLLTLSHLAGGDFRELDDEEATAVLRRIEATEFFGFVRRTTVLNLYDDADVWEALGYEGPSFDLGGYVDRGFADLDWLPEPRIESYEHPEELVEVSRGPLAVPTASGAPDTSTHPGRSDATMAEVQR